MKFKNKLLILLIFTILVFTSAFAYDKDTVVSLQIDNPIMQINGIETPIDKDYGTKPVIVNGRTLVPIRAIIESFGGYVDWDRLHKQLN